MALRSPDLPRNGTAQPSCAPFGTHVPLPTDASVTPLVVRQTWTGRTPPPFVQAWRRKLMANNPTWRFEIWDDRDCQHFMRTVAAPWMAWAYFSINPAIGAARADIWRYAVQYYCGGVYLDIDSTLNRRLVEWLDRSKPIISCEGNTVTGFDLKVSRMLNLSTDHLTEKRCVRAQWLLASPPRHPVMLKALLVVAENIASYQNAMGSGMDMHKKVIAITGPMAWTRAVNSVCRQACFWDDCFQYPRDFGGYARFSAYVPSNVTRHGANPLHGYNRLRSTTPLKILGSMPPPRTLPGPTPQHVSHTPLQRHHPSRPAPASRRPAPEATPPSLVSRTWALMREAVGCVFESRCRGRLGVG